MCCSCTDALAILVYFQRCEALLRVAVCRLQCFQQLIYSPLYSVSLLHAQKHEQQSSGDPQTEARASSGPLQLPRHLLACHAADSTTALAQPSQSRLGFSQRFGLN